MSLERNCKKCGAELAYKEQVCTQCGEDPNPRKPEKSGHFIHYFFFIPYLLAEIYGFLFCMDRVSPKGGDNAIESYIFLRMVLFTVAFIAFSYGKTKSSPLRTQGGCLLIVNGLLVLLVLYMIVFGL